jgi:hypothetical protein
MINIKIICSLRKKKNITGDILTQLLENITQIVYIKDRMFADE